MAKALLPNQCDVLHPIYGAENCCLCLARLRIAELEEIKQTRISCGGAMSEEIREKLKSILKVSTLPLLEVKQLEPDVISETYEEWMERIVNQILAIEVQGFSWG